MAPSNKAKAAGVSASSFLDLKAELAKQETQFSREKAGGAQSYVAGGLQRPDKKPTIWARANKGVRERSLRDEAAAADAAGRQTVESVRAALERKARVYDKLRKGKSGGLTDAQYDALLVDFDAKTADEHYSSDSEDVDESLTVPKPVDDADDPVVEYEDEFGRARTARRSEIPRHLMPSTDTGAQDDDPYVIHNPANFFPVFEPSAERVEAIRAAASEEANPLATHYDAARENRAKGAAFYAFSRDEETRAREMEELRRAREATEKTRTEVGAVDVRPGEVEGMVDDGQAARQAVGEGTAEAGLTGKEKVLAARSRAMEKRKRELEERKRLVAAKRRKVQNGGCKTQADGAETVSPFAALESSSTSRASSSTQEKMKASKCDQKAAAPSTVAADDFLSQLEKDLTHTR